MTLDEAIKRAADVAEVYENKLKVYENIDEDRPLFVEEETECKRCAEEHRQLAEWLKDYKRLLEQETKWIPVSERLPEDEQEILFSSKRGGVHSGKYHDDDSANQWYSHMNKCRVWNNVVTAWMPLPQLYNAESEG